jgi:cobalt-zinc-cadmium efflux system protein
MAPLLTTVLRQRRRCADRAGALDVTVPAHFVDSCAPDPPPPGVWSPQWSVHQHHQQAHQQAQQQGGSDLAQQRRRLSVVLAITVTVLLAEVVGAAVSGSLALLADAGHGLTDAAGLALALVATAFAQRPATPRRTWGYRRAEVLGAAAQAAVLLAVGVYVLVEAVRRLADPPEVASGAMLVFGAVGLVGNLVGIAVLAGSRSQSMNMRAAFLEVVNDALGSLAVIVAAVCIATLGWDRADAVASLVIGLLILPRTWLLLRETVDVLLESTPRGLDLDALRARLLAMDHVRGVHDLHATQVAANLPVLTAHVVVEDVCFHDAHLPALLDEMQTCLADEYDVEHSTFQFEREVHAEHEHSTHP